MSLKNAAFLALIGMLLLTVMLLIGFIGDILNVARGLTAPLRLLSSFVHVFAAVAVTLFFFVFGKTQS